MRSVVLSALGAGAGQMAFLQPAVARELSKRGWLSADDVSGHGDPRLPFRLWKKFRDAFSELLVLGVVGPGLNEMNDWWPWFSLTEFGRKCVEENSILPYDADSYIENLARTHPLDPVEDRFLRQSLRAYHHGLTDASTVMLGCVAEHLIVELAAGLVEVDRARAKKVESALRRIEARPLREPVNNMFDRGQAGHYVLPQALEERRPIVFSGLGDMIRVYRNDAGHPTGATSVDRELNFVLLRMFPGYRNWTREVISRLPELEWRSAAIR